MKKTMKLWMMAAILACGTTMSALAQDTKHEIGISYGAGANSTILSTLEDITAITSTAGVVSYDDAKHFGPIGVEYFYHLSQKVSVGGVLNYVRSKKDMLISRKVEGEAKINYFSVLPAVKLDWFQKSSFGMYSKLAAGLTIRSEKHECTGAEDYSKTKTFFNWQASLVGLEVGSKQVRGFAELGVGEQGIALVGLRYKF